MNDGKKLLFYSRYAFYRPNFAAFDELCTEFGLRRFLITHENAEVPKIYSLSGYLTPESAGLNATPSFVTVVPKALPTTEKLALIKKRIQEIRPDFIWAHEEPNDFFVNQMLRWFYRQRTPRIVVHLFENIWPCPGGYRARWARFRRQRLWRRFDGVLATSSRSVEAIRGYGMPTSVPVPVAWAPNLPPPAAALNGNASFLPQKQPGEFFVGFAGRITAAKGWRVLLAALTELPEQFKCLMAGTGDEEAELRLWCEVPAIRSRVHYFGVLKKDHLWSFYRSLDVFVLPSLTTPNWTEQFGYVLAEAMASGVPVIGSDSGAIPEVIANCGIVVEENNPGALAQAILAVASDPERRASWVRAGLKRFQAEYSYQAYAGKVAQALGLKQ